MALVLFSAQCGLTAEEAVLTSLETQFCYVIFKELVRSKLFTPNERVLLQNIENSLCKNIVMF